MKASRWSTNASSTQQITRWTCLEAGGIVSLTLLQKNDNGTCNRLTLQFSREEMEEILSHAKSGEWVPDRPVPRRERK